MAIKPHKQCGLIVEYDKIKVIKFAILLTLLILIAVGGTIFLVFSGMGGGFWERTIKSVIAAITLFGWMMSIFIIATLLTPTKK
jgi:hypothetical protein